MTTKGPTPIPRTVSDTVDADLHNLTRQEHGGSEERWVVRRLVEFAYAQGYSDGHNSGQREQYADHRAEEKYREEMESKAVEEANEE